MLAVFARNMVMYMQLKNLNFMAKRIRAAEDWSKAEGKLPRTGVKLKGSYRGLE